MSSLVEKKIGCAIQQKSSTREIFNPVMTQESIPQFTIPSLDILESHRVFPAKKSILWKSHQWHSQDEGTEDCKATRRCSDPVGKKFHGSFTCWVEDSPDPVTRAAMSIPHLPKITTPYGFPTLGESPHVANKESVFFKSEHVFAEGLLSSSNLHNSLFSKVPGKSVLKSAIPNAETISHENPGYPSQKALAEFHKLNLCSSSTQASNINRYGQRTRCKWVHPFVTQRSNSLPNITTNKSYGNLLQSLLKKTSFKPEEAKTNEF